MNLNNRIAVLGAIVTVLLLLAACNQTTEPRGTVPARTTDDAATDGVTETTETAEEATEEGSEGSIFGSLKEVLGAGASMRCTWSSPDGSGEVKAKGKKFHTEAQVSGMTAHGISDGVYMYSWGSSQPQGVKFKLEEW